MSTKRMREYTKLVKTFKDRAFGRDDLLLELNMKSAGGSTLRLQSLEKQGIIYPVGDGLYRISDNSEQILDELKNNSSASIGIKDSSLLALVKRFDTLLAEVR
ncbi:hypothetical protein [Providencia sp. Me31A]|uniref:hypothetical protein n=1 Tax=Providencia sp. Me31A TaxID=3392637 RepID=UPI003D2B71FA